MAEIKLMIRLNRIYFSSLLASGLLLIFALTSCGRASNLPVQAASPTIEEMPTEEPPQRLRLLFAGDAMCHIPQINAARRRGRKLDFRSSFEGVKKHFDRADIAIVNLETTISPNSTYTGYPCFSSPAEYADALAWLGTDVAVLANNHCCDRGVHGTITTIAKLDSLGISHTGVFHSEEEQQRNAILRIERNGIRLAIINYTYGTNGVYVPKRIKVNHIDTAKMRRDIELASVGSDCVIACMHWGYEYIHQPSKEQRKLAEFLQGKGVDIIVGSHPHVVQPYTATDSQITLYSLGNFVSGQRKANTDGGLLAEIDIEKGADGICRYALQTTPIWVMKPGYKLVSSEFADEVKMERWQRARYEQVVRHTTSLLKAGLKHQQKL